MKWYLISCPSVWLLIFFALYRIPFNVKANYSAFTYGIELNLCTITKFLIDALNNFTFCSIWKRNEREKKSEKKLQTRFLNYFQLIKLNTNIHFKKSLFIYIVNEGNNLSNTFIYNHRMRISKEIKRNLPFSFL